MNFEFTFTNRLAFYWSYFLSKTILLWFEVKKPKFAMFVHEMRYSLNKFIDNRSMAGSPFATEYVETCSGKFNIRPHSTDMSIISPAYERRDTLYLTRLLHRLISLDRKILVLDIGAHVGAFSVMTGNSFRDYKNLHIMAFEPALQEFQLLEKNIACNHLSEKVETCNVFLSSIDGRKLSQHFYGETAEEVSVGPSSTCKGNDEVTHTLDSLLGDRIQNFDSIVMKIDTEGAETTILKGGIKLLKSGADIYLLVEDFINPEIVTFLEQLGATFVTKRTPYNSWWQLKRKTLHSVTQPLNISCSF
ncbi:MAG: FkbM family methyltransferase [Desulfobulbaceae bacterium]|nr:FkbM family methyltransferase [Desulfobulbaceae bacterium]